MGGTGLRRYTDPTVTPRRGAALQFPYADRGAVCSRAASGRPSIPVR